MTDSELPIATYPMYCVTSAGRMLVSGTVEQFIERCEEVELEFIDPRIASERPPFVTFLTWLGGVTFAAAITALLILTFARRCSH